MHITCSKPNFGATDNDIWLWQKSLGATIKIFQPYFNQTFKSAPEINAAFAPKKALTLPARLCRLLSTNAGAPISGLEAFLNLNHYAFLIFCGADPCELRLTCTGE